MTAGTFVASLLKVTRGLDFLGHPLQTRLVGQGSLRRENSEKEKRGEGWKQRVVGKDRGWRDKRDRGDKRR